MTSRRTTFFGELNTAKDCIMRANDAIDKMWDEGEERLPVDVIKRASQVLAMIAAHKVLIDSRLAKFADIANTKVEVPLNTK